MQEFLIFIFSVVASTETFVLLILALGVVWLITSGSASMWLFYLTSIFFSVCVALIKEVTKMPRQLDPLVPVTGYSFPSGHAAAVMFLALSCSVLLRPLPTNTRYAVYAMLGIVVLAVGISRVVYRAHTIPEVVAGYLLGAAWAGVYLTLQERWS